MRPTVKTSLLLSLFSAGLIPGCSEDGNPRTGPVSYRTQLSRYSSCAALESDLKEMLRAEADARIEQSGWGSRGVPGSAEDGASAPTSDSAGGAKSGERVEGEDYSGTNNQEQGVDEADFVKTDGYHLYTINGNRLHILGVPQFGDLAPASITQLEGRPTEMLVNKDAARAVVFSQVHPAALPVEHPLRAVLGVPAAADKWYWRVEDVTKLTVLDISDRNQPRLVRELFLEGWYQTARMVGSSIRMGTYSYMMVPELDEAIWGWYGDWNDAPTREERRSRAHGVIDRLRLADLIPRIYERLPDGNLHTIAIDGTQCASFLRPTDSQGRGVSAIMSLDLLGEGLHYDADFIVSNHATYYASTDRLYLAESAHDWWWFWWNEDHRDQTNVHAFDISVPGETIYVGSGRVEGLLHNQFSLGAHEGYLRVATTSNTFARWWREDPPEAENHVFVLGEQDGALETVGHVGGIAPDERIFSARFVGDRGFLVTFEQIDPLFTLDLSDPTAPRVAGELKVPGFSTYLHPIAADRLLSIGVGGDETGANWRTQISLFDVSNFAQPALTDTEELSLEGGWSYSEAQYEHKAFQYWAPKQLLAVPMSSYSYQQTTSDTWNYQYITRLELLKVDPATGLARYGSIDHSHLFNDGGDNYFWSFRDVRRSVFMGDFIYAISDRGITAHRLTDLSLAKQVTLPGTRPEDVYWWW
jgi:hypothetical protein